MRDLDLFARPQYQGIVSWIAPSGAAETQCCHFRARRKINSSELTDSKLFITAESYYALYLNGELIGTGPARGVKTCNFLDEYDLDGLLIDGDNYLAIEVFCNNIPTFTVAPAEPALFVKLGDILTDSSWQVQFGADWRSDVPKYTFQIGYVEWRDYRKTPQGWQMFADDSQWQQAEAISDNRPVYQKKIFLRDVSMLRETVLQPTSVPVAARVKKLSNDFENLAKAMKDESYFPLEVDLSGLSHSESVTINPVDDGGVVFVIDPQQAYIGGFELDIEAPAGTVIDVGTNEEIVDGRLDFFEQYNMVDRYIHAGGRAIISNPLHYRGGRFVQFAIRDFDSPVTIYRASVVDRRYPIEKFAEFHCDNKSYNELWWRSLHTMSTCASDTLMDCPWREMAFWVNDFLVQNIYWLELVGQRDLIRRSFTLAMSQRNDEGLIPGVCPVDDNEKHVLFATNLFLPIILRDYLRFTGDVEFVESILPTVTEIFNKCQAYADKDGLLDPPEKYWNFVDWSYYFYEAGDHAYPLDGRNTCVVNWFNVLACDALAELYGRGEVSAEFDNKGDKLAEAIEKRFWNDKERCFYQWFARDDNDKPMKADVFTHSLALMSGRVSEKILPHVTHAITRDDLPQAELYMTHFTLEMLAKTGKFDNAMELIKKHWIPMLDTDTPTIWENNIYEHGKSAMGGVGSLCHAFALGPVNFFQRYVLGIQPLENGFVRFRFSPNSVGLKTVSGSVPTPYGWIEVDWKRVDDKIIAVIVVPRDTVAVLPDGKELVAGKHEVQLSC